MIVVKEYLINGMHCNKCESVIEEIINNFSGIYSVKANYKRARIIIKYDDEILDYKALTEACEKAGYSLQIFAADNKHKYKDAIFSVLAIMLLVFVIYAARNYAQIIKLPELNSDSGNGMIFLVGLLTGIHCIGMCGSFIIGYTAYDTAKKRSVFSSHIQYGLGKIISYTILGAFFGFVGSLIQITPFISGISIIIAGVFLLIYGLNMLNLFSFLRFIRIKLPKSFNSTVNIKKSKSKNPLLIGLFSGFILGCGPLQLMYVMVAGNGNILEGAKILAIFAIGTLPALFAFGMLTRLLSGKIIKNFIYVSGIILLSLGLIMINKGIERLNSRADIKTGCHCH